MSTWLGTWDVEQKAIVGTFAMVMIVTEHDGRFQVEFTSEKVAANVLDVTIADEALRLQVDLAKPLKAKAAMDLALTGPDTFTGVGKIKFLPNSSYRGVRRPTT